MITIFCETGVPLDIIIATSLFKVLCQRSRCCSSGNKSVLSGQWVHKDWCQRSRKILPLLQLFEWSHVTILCYTCTVKNDVSVMHFKFSTLSVLEPVTIEIFHVVSIYRSISGKELISS